MLSTISLESSVRRILVEKRQGFDLEAKALKKDLIESLHIDTIENVRILNRYDIEGIYGEVYENAAKTAKKAYKENISLKEACVELGFLTAEKFDEVFHPEQMA